MLQRNPHYIWKKKWLLWRKLPMSKTIEFMYSHPRKHVNCCQGSEEVIILPQWWFGEKGVKTTARNYQEDILTNLVKHLNQNIFQNILQIFQYDSAPVHKTKARNSDLKIMYPNLLVVTIGRQPTQTLMQLVLQDVVCTRDHYNLKSLKQALVEAVVSYGCRPYSDRCTT